MPTSSRTIPTPDELDLARKVFEYFAGNVCSSRKPNGCTYISVMGRNADRFKDILLDNVPRAWKDSPLISTSDGNERYNGVLYIDLENRLAILGKTKERLD